MDAASGHGAHRAPSKSPSLNLLYWKPSKHLNPKARRRNQVEGLEWMQASQPTTHNSALNRPMQSQPQAPPIPYQPQAPPFNLNPKPPHSSIQPSQPGGGPGVDAASGHGAHRAAQVQEAPDGRARRDWRRGPGNLLFLFMTLELRVVSSLCTFNTSPLCNRFTILRSSRS